MNRVTLALALAFALAAPRVEAQDTPRATTEREVVEVALRTHPSIESLIEAREAARDSLVGARLARVPDLRLSARYTRLSNVPERYRTFGGAVFPILLDSFSSRAALTVPVLDTFLSLAANVRAAGLAEEASRLELELGRARIAHDARLAYLDVWARTFTVRSAEEAVRAAEANLADARLREQEGAASRNEVLPLETALDDAAIALETERGELVAAEAALQAIAPGVRVVVVATGPEEPGTTAVAEVASPEAADSPEVAALALQARAAEERVDSASWSRLPQLSLFANADLAAPNPRVFAVTELTPVATWEVGVQLEWSLSQLAGARSRSAQARQEHASALARLEEARRRITSERSAANAALATATARLTRAADQVVRAEELARARRGELAAGAAEPLAVVIAEVDLARARNAWIAARVTRAAAVAKLDLLAGRSDPETLSRGFR